MKAKSAEQLQALIERLQLQVSLHKAKQKKAVIAIIFQAVQQFGISSADLKGVFRAQRLAGLAIKARGASSQRGVRGKRIAPKYRDPKTGETWSGRGRPARWIAEAEKKGTPRARFLIK